MAEDTPTGETATPQAPSNDPSSTSAPQGQQSDAAVEVAKREAEQAKMRANQLENELKKIREKAAEDDRKKLEENQEWKTLAEKNAEEAKGLREAAEARERSVALQAVTDAVLQDYPANVVEVAKTAGLSLSDDTDAAKNAFKERLDTIQKSVGTATPVSPNNPGPTTPEEMDRQRLVTPDAEGVTPLALAGARGDNRPLTTYVNELSALKEMRRMNGLPETPSNS